MAADDKVGGEVTPKEKHTNTASSFPTFALYRYHANRYVPNDMSVDNETVTLKRWCTFL